MKRKTKAAPTVQSLAKELAASLVTGKRDNGDSYVHLADDRPQWMQDVIRKAHGDAMPDDTIYAIVGTVAETLAGMDEGTRANAQDAISGIEADVYTHNLTEWLHARADHVYYLTEALEQFEPKDGFQLLAMAQKLQIEEIGNRLANALAETGRQTP